MNMLSNMVRSTTRTKLKIFYSIIGWFTVYVMDVFGSFKKSSKIFFHYKTVFINIFITIWKRMFRGINKNITRTRLNSSTASPVSSQFTKPSFTYLTDFSALFDIRSPFSWLAFKKLSKTMMRTKFTLSPPKYKPCYFKMFMTIKTLTDKFSSLFLNNNLFHILIVNRGGSYVK